MRLHARSCSYTSDEKIWPPGLDVLWGDRHNELKMWCRWDKQVWWKSYEWGDNRAEEGMAALPVLWGSTHRTCTSLVDPVLFGAESMCTLQSLKDRVVQVRFQSSACNTMSIFHRHSLYNCEPFQVSSHFITWLEVFTE